MPRLGAGGISIRRRVTAISSGGGGGIGAVTYTAQIKRYDGGTGIADFYGTIPFAPGVVTSSANLAGVVVKVAGSEPASGIYLALAEAYHADGSYRCARLHFRATVNDANPVACTVQITGGTRTVADISTPPDTIEFVSRAWMVKPTLFAITDADYLCASRIAPLPIVPLAHANVPANAYTWATTGFDYWYNQAVATVNPGGATYDDGAAHFGRYIATGSIDDLRRGLGRFGSDYTNDVTDPLAGCDFTFWLPSATFAWADLDLNPKNYAGSLNSDVMQTTEAGDGLQFSAYYAYVLGGWEYGRICNAQHLVGMSMWNDSGLPNGEVWHSAANHRPLYRKMFLSGMLNYLHRENRKMSSQYFTFTPGTSSLATRINNQITTWKAEETSVTRPSWLPAIWGIGAMDASSDGQPNITLNVNSDVGLASRTGTGTLTINTQALSNLNAPASFGLPDTYLGKWLVTMTSATAFTVTDPYGTAWATGTVGTPYTNNLQFTIAAGGTPFVAGDKFSLSVTKMPTFQLFLEFMALWTCYVNGANTDAAIPTQLDTLAGYIDNLFIGPVTVSGRSVYGMPYNICDPAKITTIDDIAWNSVFATTCGTIAQAWKYARSGHTDTTARDRFDAIARYQNQYFWVAPDGSSTAGQNPALKEFGEFFVMFFHALFLRAGGAWNGWTI